MRKENTIPPETSLAAYDSMKFGEIEKHHLLILSALKELKFAMYEEIALKTGLEKTQVGRRISELERDNKIYKSGIQKETSTGRKAFCYTLTFGTGIAVSKKEEIKKKERRKSGLPHIQQTFL